MSLISYRLRKHLPRSHRHFTHSLAENQLSPTLADLHPGDRASILGFSPAIAAERLYQLQSYGLLPASHIAVVQNWPVVVVQVEHTELAIENDLACQILICEGS